MASNPDESPPTDVDAPRESWRALAEREQQWPPGALYVVATPIGNLRDVTLRALDCLARMNAIAAEDTRIAKRLLNAFDIHATVFPVHQHNEAEAAQSIIKRLDAAERVAFISDAGTPGISDPGARLVKAVRDAGHRVIPLPGASALTTAVSAAGLPEAPIVFLGFLPARAGAARRALEAFPTRPVNIVLYEAPHRMKETLELLCEVFGRARQAMVARELTKLFETIRVATLGELFDAAGYDEMRGEFVLIIEAVPVAADTEDEHDKMLRRLLRSVPLSEAVAITCELTGAPRKTLYARALLLKSASA